jgi:deoxyribose-phosphate aldolase
MYHHIGGQDIDHSFQGVCVDYQTFVPGEVVDPSSVIDCPPIMADSQQRQQRIQATISEFQHFHYSEPAESNGPPPSELHKFIDHTLLRPDATMADIEILCKEAEKYNFKTVCVNSSWLTVCNKFLPKSQCMTVPIAVIGFPLGAGITSSKCFEAKAAIDAGAKEIDMVIPIGRLKAEDYEFVFEDIKAVYDSCGDIPLKVILETSMLTHDEIVAACCICKEIGVAFVKTCTGFAGGGATVQHVALMKAVVGQDIQVKASGGIRTFNDARRMIKAGATRIGASASVAIVTAPEP